MRRLARVVRLVGLTCLFAGSSACGGDTIRLGDGTSNPALAAACPHGAVQADELLWIGDTWINIPGTQHTRVRDLARAAGAIGPSDDYVDLAAGATTLAMIVDQYATQQAGPTKVKVLIMDGGTWDTILSG